MITLHHLSIIMPVFAAGGLGFACVAVFIGARDVLAFLRKHRAFPARRPPIASTSTSTQPKKGRYTTWQRRQILL